MRKLISLLLVFLLAASLVIPAFATGEGGEGGGTGGSGGEGGGTQDPPACSHSWTNACDTTCDLGCGHTRTITHSFGNWTDTGSGTHTRTCTVCSHPESGSHSCTSWTQSDLSHSGACSACGAAMTYTHTFSNWTKTDDTNHSRTCTVCSKSVSNAHTWNAGAVTTEPSCVPGVKTYTCTVCSGTKTEAIAATNHVYRNATYLDATNHTMSCIGCPDSALQSHSWNAGVVTTPATCTADGVKTYTCSVCSGTKTETITKTGIHDYNAWQDGTTHVRTCKNCTAQDSHAAVYGSYVTTTAATCKDAGVMTASCTGVGCTLKKTEAIAKLTEHTYDNECDPECNVCKATRTPEHKFNKYYTYSSSYHWYACSQCKEKKGQEPHVPGPLPTEDKGQVCLDCNYEMMPKKGHTHKYDENKWESDETGHWYKCKDCGVEVEFDDHTFTGDCGSGCKVCGYVSKNGHIYDGTYESDKASHWAICKVCDTVSEPEEHIPGPEATASKPQTCTICGYELAVLEEHEHEFGQWITNNAEHWKQCECGEKQDQGAHAWDEGVKGKDKTITHTCIDCGETMIEIQAVKKNNTPMVILLVVLVLCFLATLALLINLILKGRKGGKYS